jgi:hypothetical protein
VSHVKKKPATDAERADTTRRAEHQTGSIEGVAGCETSQADDEQKGETERAVAQKHQDDVPKDQRRKGSTLLCHS